MLLRTAKPDAPALAITLAPAAKPGPPALPAGPGGGSVAGTRFRTAGGASGNAPAFYGRASGVSAPGTPGTAASWKKLCEGTEYAARISVRRSHAVALPQLRHFRPNVRGDCLDLPWDPRAEPQVHLQRCQERQQKLR